MNNVLSQKKTGVTRPESEGKYRTFLAFQRSRIK